MPRFFLDRLYGAGRGTRTPDLRFTKPLLYQLSYAGRMNSKPRDFT
jgi:hypothetical protein